MPTPLDALTLDAGFTLVRPRRPVAELYLDEARALGLDLPEDAFHARVEAVWRDGGSLRSGDDSLRSSQELELDGWHRFTAEVAAPWPELRSRHEEWLQALFARFDDPAAWEPLPGVRDALHRLREAGLRLAVVSNWHLRLPVILSALDLDEPFAFVLTSAAHGFRKPARSIFDAALSRLGVPAARAAHIGDSWEDDVLGARSAGMLPLLLGSEAPDGDPVARAADWPAAVEILLRHRLPRTP